MPPRSALDALLAPRRRWVVRRSDREIEQALERDLGVSPLLCRLLALRGLRSGEAAAGFLEASLARHLRSPMLFREMPVAARRLLDAVRRRERVAIYGDYDADGITGATELVLFLRELGVEPDVHVPHRLREGYGLREDVLRRFAESGVRLVVTADCGAGAHEPLEVARRLGLDVIVCDHHQAPDTRPPAHAVLNPVVRDAGFPFSGLSAAGVVFYLLLGTRMLMRESGESGPDLRRYLDLVALGTVADLVPIVEENRVLVKYGVQEIARTSRPGIRALCEVAAVENVNVETLAFRLAPRINASGRLAEASTAVRLLATESREEARSLAGRLDEHNRDRRGIEEAICEEADLLVQSMPDRTRRRSFVLAGEGWHAGVVGIVASRLVDRYARPVVVLAIEGETSRGSARSIPSVNLFQTLRGCADLLAAYGGHRMAAGLTVRTSAIPALADRFERLVASATRDEDFLPVLTVDCTVPIDALSLEVLADLERLEPHGSGNPKPLLLAQKVEVHAARIVGERHLKLGLRREDGTIVDAIGFGMGDRLSALGKKIDVVYSAERNRWDGTERLQMVLRDMRNTL